MVLLRNHIRRLRPNLHLVLTCGGLMTSARLCIDTWQENAFSLSWSVCIVIKDHLRNEAELAAVPLAAIIYFEFIFCKERLAVTNRKEAESNKSWNYVTFQLVSILVGLRMWSHCNNCLYTWVKYYHSGNHATSTCILNCPTLHRHSWMKKSCVQVQENKESVFRDLYLEYNANTLLLCWYENPSMFSILASIIFTKKAN